MKFHSINTLAVFLVVGMVVMPGAIIGTPATPTDELFSNEDPSLVMSPADGPNGDYVVHDQDGKLKLDFEGGGLNANATTEIDRVFTITSTDTRTLTVWVTHDGGDSVTLRNHVTGDPVDSDSSAVQLGPGEQMVVDIEIDSHGEDIGEQVLTRVSVHAGFETPDGGDSGDQEDEEESGGGGGGLLDEEEQGEEGEGEEEQGEGEGEEGEEEEQGEEEGEEEDGIDGVEVVFDDEGDSGDQVTGLSESDIADIDAQTTQEAPTAVITADVAVEAAAAADIDAAADVAATAETAAEAEAVAGAQATADTDIGAAADVVTGGGGTVVETEPPETQVEDGVAIAPVKQEFELSGEFSTVSETESITQRGQVTRAVDIDVPPGREDDSAMVRLEVDRDAFGQTNPEDAQIGHWTGDGWQLLSTDVVETTQDSVVVEARTRGFSPFAVFTDPDVEYTWTFPDGTTESGQTVRHAFDDPGNYTVELTVEDALGRQDSSSLQIIADDVPRAAITTDRDEGATNTTLVADVNNTVGDTSVTWTLPDGTQRTGTQISHDLAEGEHEITLTVEDEYGASMTVQRRIAVGPKGQLIQTTRTGGPLVLLSLFSTLILRAGRRCYRLVPWREMVHRFRSGPKVTELSDPVIDWGSRCLRISSLSVYSRETELTDVRIELSTADGQTVVAKELAPDEPYEYAPESAVLPLLPDTTLDPNEVYVIEVTATDANGRSDQLRSQEFVAPEGTEPETISSTSNSGLLGDTDGRTAGV